MKTTINQSQFQDAFMSIRPDNFSYEGLSLLFDFLEELENDQGEEIELDVIAFCCDFSEDTIQDVINNYNIVVSDRYDFEDEEDRQTSINEAVIEYIQENSTFIGMTDDNTILYQQF